jgi:hypothetical protein
LGAFDFFAALGVVDILYIFITYLFIFILGLIYLINNYSTDWYNQGIDSAALGLTKVKADKI